MFDANQMFKQKNPTPSSAEQAEFAANFYERMLEEGQGDGVTRFSDDILFLISVFLCVVTSSVVCETGFSKLNLIKTKLRNRLCVPNLDNLMMVLVQRPQFPPRVEGAGAGDQPSGRGSMAGMERGREPEPREEPLRSTATEQEGSANGSYRERGDH
jgi:hypothetical protein